MAIQWGGWDGHLRVGIEWSTDPYTYSTPSVNVYIDTWVQCDSVFNFNDGQTVTLTGTYFATYNFQNNLQANQAMRVGTYIVPNQQQNPNGGPNYGANANLSGAYNGAAPYVATGFTLPAKPPNPASPPYAPTLNSPAWDTIVDTVHSPITFSWTFNDPDGGPQNQFVLMLTNPSGTAYRYDGTNLIPDNGATVTGGSQTSITVPAGKITVPGRWVWDVHTQDTSGLWGPRAYSQAIWVSTPPSATVTTPANPSTIARPQINWTYTDVDGTAQNGWQAQIVKSSVYSAAGYNPDNMLGQTWSNSASNTATSATPDVDLPNHTTMRAYVKVNSSPFPSGGLQYSQWAYKQFDLHVPPNAPSVSSPKNGAIVDLQAGFTMSWTNSFYTGTGGITATQAAFALRRKQGTGAYEWWNGTTWQTTEYFLSGTAASYTFRSGEVANGVQWTFAVAIRDGYGGQSPYATSIAVTGSTAAQVTVTQPTAIVTTSTPDVQWSLFDLENDPQQTYQVRIISSTVYNLGIADPLTATAVWDTTEIADASTRRLTVPVDLSNGTTYRAYVRVKTGGVYSGWSYNEFVVSLQPPAQPTLTLTVLPDSGAVQIDIQGRDSLLTGDAGRAYAGWGPGTNATVVGTQTPFNAAQSGYAMRFSSVAAGAFSIKTTDNYVITQGITYTAAATLVVTSGTARAFHVDIEWLNAGLTVVSTTVGATSAVDSTAQTAMVNGSAPATALYARLSVVVVGATAANETHDLYDVILRPGIGIEWSPGGLLGDTSVSIVAQNPYRIVRRGLNIPMDTVTQQATIYDEEIPNGVPQVYGGLTRAVYPTAILASPTILTDPVTWTSGWLWLSDPLRPGSGYAWAPQSFGQTTRPVRQGKFRPIARPDAVLTTGVRALREGSFTILMHSKEERDRFDSFCDQSEYILIRIPPDQGEDAGEAIYAKFEGDAPQERQSPHRTPHRAIEQHWVEQRRPVTQLDYSDELDLMSDTGIQVFIGLDTDGVPYYDSNTPGEQSTVALARDTDGTVYFQSFV